MDLTEIRKIVELMDEHGLSQFQFEKEDFNLKLKKGTDFDELQKLMGSMPAAGSAAPAPVAVPVSVPDAPAANTSVGEEINSPMVGTFYRKPTPDDPDL